MSGYADHVRAGVRFYDVFLALALGLWVAGSHLPIDGSAYLLPIGATAVRSVLAVALCVVIAVLASLAPDVDIKSKGQLLFYRGFLAVDVALLVLFYTRQDLRFLEGAAFLGLLGVFPLLGKHRGWTHSRFALLLLPAPLIVLPLVVYGEPVWLGVPYYLAGLIGYASHLHLDGRLLPSWLWPRRRARSHGGRAKASRATLAASRVKAVAEISEETVRDHRPHSDRPRKRA